jgi:quercetin dioxygenase-like cupin family protein
MPFRVLYLRGFAEEYRWRRLWLLGGLARGVARAGFSDHQAEKETEMDSIRAIRGGAIPAGPPTEGMNRKTAELHEGVVAAETSMQPQAVSGWHHHGGHTAYVYVARGQVRVEWGPGGRESLDLASGDFYVVPPNTVHREGNPGVAEQTVVLGFLVGTGLEALNVEGPEPAA